MLKSHQLEHDKMYELYGQLMQGGEVSLDRVSSAIAEVYPDLWKRFYSRHVEAPGNYVGHKAQAVAWATCLIEIMHRRDGVDTACNGAVNALILERFDFPTYYVSQPLAQALLHTHPPEHMTWGDMIFPFDGVTFMLPAGTLFEPGGAEIFMVGVARTEGNDKFTLPGFRRAEVKGLGTVNIPSPVTITALPEPRVDIYWSVKPCGLEMQDCCFPLTMKLEPDSDWIDTVTNEHRERIGYTGDLPQGDFSAYVAGLIANLILVMQARPGLLEHGKNTGRRLKSGAVIHTPTMLGRRYEIERRYQKAAPTGAHYTELRWRAGHIRRRRVELGWDDPDNRIFIDPYIAYGANLVREPSAVEA